jgi:hypothetical protein
VLIELQKYYCKVYHKNADKQGMAYHTVFKNSEEGLQLITIVEIR